LNAIQRGGPCSDAAQSKTEVRMDEPDHEFRSRCSIARSLELLGDKWTLLIVRDLLWHDKHTFQELQNSEEHMPTNLLAQRLKRLMAWGLVTRQVYQHRPTRYRYELSSTGRDLEPILLQIMAWGHAQLGGGLYDPVRKMTTSIGT
jgi:DNA-binding HxlR family transcriptional regulator